MQTLGWKLISRGGGGGEFRGPETVQHEFNWVCAAGILNTKPESDSIFYV